MKHAIALCVVMIASGCASIKLGDPVKGEEIKKFDRMSDKAQIYVCRDSRTFGLAIRPDIQLDGKDIGTVARSTFAYAEVPPGNHTLVAKTLEHDSKLPVSVMAGEQRFFQTWISVGVFAGWGLIDEIDAAKGKACVTEGEFVEAATR